MTTQETSSCKVQLLHHTPLWVCAKAIRKCWSSEDKSDSMKEYCSSCNLDITDLHLPAFPDGMTSCPKCDANMYPKYTGCGPKDCELIDRVGNKNKHSSTLEHLSYTFDINGISRACLQELARHRHASLSVKSSRYTLAELKHAPDMWYDAPKDCDWKTGAEFLVFTGNTGLDAHNILTLGILQRHLKKANDKTKYMLPEAYKTSLVWTINARSLQNFLSLRTAPAALWEIRDLANTIYSTLPSDHKYLFTDSLYKAAK